MGLDMKLFKVITVLISLLVSSTALADSNKLKETEGNIGNVKEMQENGKKWKEIMELWGNGRKCRKW